VRWHVEILRIKGDEQSLLEALAPLELQIGEIGGKKCLVGVRFETLNDAVAVHIEADNVAALIYCANILAADLQASFDVGTEVTEVRSDGERRVIQRNAIIRGSRLAGFVGGSGIICIPSAKAVTLIIAASRNSSARRVQALLAEELTPTTIYHIYELIRADQGSALKNLTSSTQLDRLTRSVNHPEVHGHAARHIVSKSDPPSNPMRIIEARSFIRELAYRWFESDGTIKAQR
jgi:hypothetical protein